MKEDVVFPGLWVLHRRPLRLRLLGRRPLRRRNPCGWGVRCRGDRRRRDVAAGGRTRRRRGRRAVGAVTSVNVGTGAEGIWQRDPGAEDEAAGQLVLRLPGARQDDVEAGLHRLAVRLRQFRHAYFGDKGARFVAVMPRLRAATLMPV